MTSLLLFGTRQDRSQRNAESDCPSCGRKANVRAAWHRPLQKPHRRAKVQRGNSPVDPCPAAPQKPKLTAPGPWVKHNSSSFKPSFRRTPVASTAFMARRHAKLYQAFWKMPGPEAGCPHRHLHLILTGSNNPEACAGLPAQRLGASNGLHAQEQGKKSQRLQKSIQEAHLAVGYMHIWNHASPTCQRGKAGGLEPGR